MQESWQNRVFRFNMAAIQTLESVKLSIKSKEKKTRMSKSIIEEFVYKIKLKIKIYDFQINV